MKTEELMIGDWVCVTKNFTQKYHKIRALSNNEGAVLRGIYVNEYGVESYSIFSPNDTEPIPLTPEILEKNGFVVESRDCHGEPLQYCELVDGLWVDISGENYFEGKLEYVHQLQQVLRLCGIPREIIIEL